MSESTDDRRRQHQVGHFEEYPPGSGFYRGVVDAAWSGERRQGERRQGERRALPINQIHSSFERPRWWEQIIPFGRSLFDGLEDMSTADFFTVVTAGVLLVMIVVWLLLG
jgi:hypothetical protein